MMRRGGTFALVLFLLGTLASESLLAGGGGRGGGSHGAGVQGGGHRGGSFHGGKHFHQGHGGKHFHQGHGRVGVFVGAPVIFGGWAYTSPFFYPPPVFYPSAPYYPPTYIEQGVWQPAPQQQPAPAYWYYCPQALAYYPYVKECSGGWQQVVPQPPPS